ncbi:MAG TPA: thioredoxin domain-containing protein [Gemmatimonadales bacterium]|nr:thioredoxin domain-containing protein [Gemmatimonadales bacterium]
MNRLATATSAYLASAAHQPVAWWPWCAEAFEEARRLDRPVLLDIGAVWCHWCHVMDGESYEDPTLAELLNASFTCIKVDRDERPDIDARYQRAVQALSGVGGWPLTAFLTPGGEVFFGGTYFPPQPLQGRHSFRQVVTSVRSIWDTQRDRVTAQATALTGVVRGSLDERAPADPTEELLVQAEEKLTRHFEPKFGGWGPGPKFPHPAAVSFLLARWADQGGDLRRAMAVRTLEGMRRGGMHDHLGGGFHRYSVDVEWIVPHFEKMSYDNAELAKAYLDAHAAFGDSADADVVLGVIRWVKEVLADPEGGYGASQDADVGLHDDGDYFTWTLAEAAAELTPEELEVAAARYDIGTAGEMHHDPARNVLYAREELPAIAERLGRPAARVAQELATAEEKLKTARRRRTAPFIDRTRYTNWNGMLAGAMLRAGAVLGDRWAADHALRSLERIRAEAPAPDAVGHLPGTPPTLLDDQVQVAAAALDAWEVTGDRGWLDWATALMERAWRDHGDPAAPGLFDLAAGVAGEGLLPDRAKPVQDTPTPSPNAVAALTAARLAHHLDGPEWHTRHRELVHAFAGRAAELGLFGATFLVAMTWALAPVTQLVIVGEGDEADRMHRRALATFIPRKVVQRLRPPEGGRPSAPLPAYLAAMVDGASPRAYVCRGENCLAPAATDTEWKERLQELRRSS